MAGRKSALIPVSVSFYVVVSLWVGWLADLLGLGWVGGGSGGLCCSASAGGLMLAGLGWAGRSGPVRCVGFGLLPPPPPPPPLLRRSPRVRRPL